MKNIFLITIISFILIIGSNQGFTLTYTNEASLRLQVPNSFGLAIEKGKIDLKKKLWDEQISDAEKSETISPQAFSASSLDTTLDFGKHDPGWDNFEEPGEQYTLSLYIYNNSDPRWYLSMKCDTEFKIQPNGPSIPFLTSDGKYSNFGWVAGDDSDGKGIVYSYPPPGGGMTNHSTTERRVYYNDGKEISESIWIWNGLQIPFDQKATAEGESYTTNIILTVYTE